MKKKNNYSDYTIDNLPKNRHELFYDILKHNIRYIIYIGIILLIAFTPLLIFEYLNLASISDVINNDISLLSEAYIFKDGIDIILYAFISIILAGIFNVIKQLTYNEGFIFKNVFIKGIKNNFKDFLYSSMLFGILIFIFDFIAVKFISIETIVYYLLNAFKVILLVPFLIILLGLSNIYSDKFFTKVIKAFIITIKNYFRVIFLTIITLIPLCLLFINNGYVTLIVPIIYLFIYLPIALIYVINALNYIFDKDINQFYFKEIVDKGLHK